MQDCRIRIFELLPFFCRQGYLRRCEVYSRCSHVEIVFELLPSNLGPCASICDANSRLGMRFELLDDVAKAVRDIGGSGPMQGKGIIASPSCVEKERKQASSYRRGERLHGFRMSLFSFPINVMTDVFSTLLPLRKKDMTVVDEVSLLPTRNPQYKFSF